MPQMTGIELLAEAKRLRPEMPVVLMTAFATVATAVEAMKLGAYDYIQKPFDGDEIKLLVDRTLEHSRLIKENAALRSMAEQTAPRPLIGSGRAMAEVRREDRAGRPQQRDGADPRRERHGQGSRRPRHSRRLARGASGRCSPSTARPCRENLLESELFGHEKGAFTGADRLRRGRFELADGGTLLLDEISEIAPSLQAKLLRVLQESTFERVGSSVSQQVDVRVIATTNRDLEAAVAEGKFRAGPVLPAERRADRTAAAAAAGGGRPGAVPAFPPPDRQAARTRRSATSSPKRCGCCSGTPGRATCASCRTSSSGPACWRPSRAWSAPRRSSPGCATGDAGGVGRRRPGGQAAGGHREAGDPQHAPAVQGPPHQDRRGAGHRRADAGHEAQAVEGRWRAGRGAGALDDDAPTRAPSRCRETSARPRVAGNCRATSAELSPTSAIARGIGPMNDGGNSWYAI